MSQYIYRSLSLAMSEYLASISRHTFLGVVIGCVSFCWSRDGGWVVCPAKSGAQEVLVTACLCLNLASLLVPPRLWPASLHNQLSLAMQAKGILRTLLYLLDSPLAILFSMSFSRAETGGSVLSLFFLEWLSFLASEVAGVVVS